MRRSSSLKSQPFSQQTLHPVLQAMLGNLDVQLDEELARYRRQNGRRGGQTNLNRPSQVSQVPLTPLPGVGETVTTLPSEKTGNLSTAASKQLEVNSSPTSLSHGQTAHAATGLGIAGLSLAIASDPDLLSTDPYATPPKVALLNVHPQTEEQMVDPSIVSSADLVADSGDAWGPDDYLESSEHLLHSLADEEVELRTSQEPGMLQSLLTPLGIGSMLLLLLSSVTFGYLLMNPSSMSFLGLGANQQTPAPNLATGSDIAGTAGVSNAAAPRQEVSPNLSAQEFPEVNLDTLSTLPKTTAIAPSNPPLTDASSPARTDSSAAIAPAASPSLNSRPDPSGSQPISRTSASTNSAINSSRTSPATASTASPSSRSARNADTSSQQTRPRGAAAPARTSAGSSRSPAANSTNGRPSSPAPSPQRVTTQPSQPRLPSPAPTVATAPRVPAVAPSPRTSPPESPASLTYYYVVMDFSGDRSLEQARQVVGDAFLRNFSDGAKIQFGRFVDRERASALARDLQSQGVSARVYQP